jgi:hypothetical protein
MANSQLNNSSESEAEVEVVGETSRSSGPITLSQDENQNGGQNENEATDSTHQFRSKIWEYFKYLEKEKQSQCKHCKSKLAGKFTTNLKQHLKRKHKKLNTEYENLVKEEEKRQQEAAQKQQATKRVLGLQSSDSGDRGTIKKVRKTYF